MVQLMPLPSQNPIISTPSPRCRTTNRASDGIRNVGTAMQQQQLLCVRCVGELLGSTWKPGGMAGRSASLHGPARPPARPRSRPRIHVRFHAVPQSFDPVDTAAVGSQMRNPDQRLIWHVDVVSNCPKRQHTNCHTLIYT